MILGYSFKTLLFSVCLFFYQQGLTNDTYGIEEFLEYHKASWKPPSTIKERHKGQSVMSPLENIRIGFIRLNLTSDDVSGDERLEICENYEVAEQDFNRLISFYFNYVNMSEQYRKFRIQRMLRLIHCIFSININKTTEKKPEDQQLINTAAKSLFEHLFLSHKINGRRNPYFIYFDLSPIAYQSNYFGVNNGLVLMFLAFLAPHFLSKDELYNYIRILDNRYTEKSYNRAFDRELLSENINEYNSPRSIANQLTTAQLDAGTALLIGLTAMASAAFQRMDSGMEWQETLETLLIRCLPYELLAIVYSNITSHCRPEHWYPVPAVMFTEDGMQEFTQSIMGIDFTHALSVVSSSESPEYPSGYSEGTDSDDSVEESDSEHWDQAIVIQQQNELIAQLRQELA
ncbi:MULTISPECIES: hypothetical protein, partial [unclassified Endozoicomonas]